MVDCPQPDRAIRAVVAPDARLVGDGGVVVARDGSLVLETLWDEEDYGRDYSEPRRVPKPAILAGTHASLITTWHANYYHWMVDALPRLAVLEAAGLQDVSLIVPDPLATWQQEMLDRVGVTRDRLTPYSRQHVRPEHLVWATAPAYVNFATPFVVTWLRERLGGHDRLRGERRIYLKRSTSRRLENEDEVLRVLDRFGFETVEPDTMSVAEQVRTLSTARVLVAAHGAGIANAVFCDQLSLLELFQPGFFTPPYFTLAGAAGWDYWYLTCEASHTSRASRSVKYANLHVPLDLLEATVRAMLSGS